MPCPRSPCWRSCRMRGKPGWKMAAARQEEETTPEQMRFHVTTAKKITVFCKTHLGFLGFFKVMKLNSIFRRGSKFMHMLLVIFFWGKFICLCCLRFKKVEPCEASKPQNFNKLVAHRLCEMSWPKGFFSAWKLETSEFENHMHTHTHAHPKSQWGLCFFLVPRPFVVAKNQVKGGIWDFPNWVQATNYDESTSTLLLEVTLVLAHRWSRSLRVWRLVSSAVGVLPVSGTSLISWKRSPKKGGCKQVTGKCRISWVSPLEKHHPWVIVRLLDADNFSESLSVSCGFLKHLP